MRSGNQLTRMLRRHDRRKLTGRALIRRGREPNVTVVGDNVPCLVRPSERATTEVTSGGGEVAITVYDVRVPYDLDLKRGDTITLTRSFDQFQVGWWCTVVEVLVDEWVTTRVAVAHRSRS